MKMLNKKIATLTCSALLAACGGGGGDSTASNTGGQSANNNGSSSGNNTNIYSTVEITDVEFDEFQATGASLVRPGSSTEMSYSGTLNSDHNFLQLRNGAFFFGPRSDDTSRDEVETDEEVELPYSYRYTVNDQVVEYFDDYTGVVFEHDGADRLETASNFLLQISQPLIPTDATHMELLYNGEVYKRNDITNYALWVHALEFNGF